MATTTSLANQVWVGAGASATMIPEMDIYLVNAECNGTNGADGFETELQDLVPGLYVGCMATVTNDTTANDPKTVCMITANTADTITFDRDVGADGNVLHVRIHAFGAPIPSPKVADNKPKLLADNWLGLVNTITPPSVDIELGQVSLALSGRNFGYQFKKNETVSGGSMDISLGNGMWLYYALGSIKNVTHTAGATLASDGSGFVTTGDDQTTFVRAISGKLYPPMEDSSITDVKAYGDMKVVHATNAITYGFKESNADHLPSFALDVTMEKGDIADAHYYVGSEGTSTDATARPFKDIYSRIYTGCQLNTLTLNFEEGQEVKASLDLVSRRAFDSPLGYHPKNNVRTHTSFQNYSSTDSDNQPYLFSGGQINVFGQTVARVKTGSLTINNNITPQRFVGSYSRDITTTHIPGQRTYEVSLTMLVTDTDVWDNLRAQGEHTSSGTDETLRLKFTKEGNANDVLQIELTDYIVQSVDVPFPEDKGPIEMNVTLSARTLVEGNAGQATGTYYKGRWVIQNADAAAQN
tara:strand:- start:1364 stop:2941 length:1578 start_codon:yes stop_codon:yes gene_type:complete